MPRSKNLLGVLALVMTYFLTLNPTFARGNRSHFDLAPEVKKSLVTIRYKPKNPKMTYPKIAVLKSLNNETTILLKYRSTQDAVDFSCLASEQSTWHCSNDCGAGSITVKFQNDDFTEIELEPFTLSVGSCDPNESSLRLSVGKPSKTILKRAPPF